MKFKSTALQNNNILSLPLRECGLKCAIGAVIMDYPASLPLRECGLKFKVVKNKMLGSTVTPLAGVWVEIEIGFSISDYVASLPLRECGLKFGLLVRKLDCESGHSPCGSVG